MSTTDYRNQEALNKALNIYRAAMRPFIISCLRRVQGTDVESAVTDSLGYRRADEIERLLVQKDRSIESAIDINDFPHIVNKNWDSAFDTHLNDDKTFRNQLWLIVECRNAEWAHPPEGDAECERTRAHLFLIVDVLGKINRPDEQSEVEAIRDALFSDDTAERLEKAEEDNVEYKKSLAEVEQSLATAESEKNEYAEKNVALSEQVDEKENQRKKLDKQLKRAKTQNDKYKKDIAGTKQRLKESEAAQADYKERFETTEKELEDTKAKWQTCEESLKATSDRLEDAVGAWMTSMENLTAMRELFKVATIENQAVQAVYPPIQTDSTVRILDRRDVNKKNYLLELLEQRQPTIIYVQSEEMVDRLLERVVPEKADLIERYGGQTSEAEEREILEKLEKGEKIAVVSDATLSTLASSHCLEHFIFCHLVPGLDEFFKLCEPAFTSEKNTYLHLIYNTNQDIDALNQWLTQKYPDAEALGKLYRELKELDGTDGDLIKLENVYNENVYSKLDMVKLGVETGLAIFEELQFLERNETGVKLLPDPDKRGLDESEIHCSGEDLKQGMAEVQAFQLKHPIEQIWETILEKLDVDSEQILREDSIDEMYASVSEIESDQQPMETVENDNEADDGETGAGQASKPSRANAKVTEEQVREIRSRSAAGESNSELAKEFDLSPTAVRNIVLRNTWKDVE